MLEEERAGDGGRGVPVGSVESLLKGALSKCTMSGTHIHTTVPCFSGSVSVKREVSGVGSK